MQQLLDAQQLAFNKKCEGMTMPVLIEKQGGRDGQMTGRSPFMQSVYLEGEASWIGRIMELEITRRGKTRYGLPLQMPQQRDGISRVRGTKNRSTGI